MIYASNSDGSIVISDASFSSHPSSNFLYATIFSQISINNSMFISDGIVSSQESGLYLSDVN